MTNPLKLALLVVIAHWIVSVSHLFIAARIMPAPDNHVSGTAIALMTLVHAGLSLALWKVSVKVSGSFVLLFFLAALAAGVYEHFVHAASNNVFMVTPGDWTAWFNASVFVLLALEVVGASLGFLLIGGKTSSHQPRAFNSPSGKQGSGLTSHKFQSVSFLGDAQQLWAR